MPQNRIGKGAAFLLCVVESASDVPTNQTSKFIRSSYNTANQLTETYNSENDTTTTYTYDVLGNLLTDGSKTYTYNIRGQQATFIIPNGTLKHLQEVIGNSSHTKRDSR